VTRLMGVLRSRKLDAWQRYAIAVSFVLLVVGGRLALDPWWGKQNNRHLVLLPTVMLAAWIGGFGPGVVAATLSTIALAFLWADPGHSSLQESIGPLLFSLISVAVAKVIASLQIARAAAEASRASQKQILAVVAHDLRNPLHTIKMTSSALGHATPDSTLVGRLRSIDRAVGRMENLIRDLVDANRIEHGELAVAMRDEKVEAIVEDTMDIFAPLASEKGITLEARVDNRELEVRCDKDRLLQVLGNLLGNALRFTPKGGRVALYAESGDDTVRFEVADSGPGILPEHFPHLFEPYWKGDPGGTGLGLFIAQSIVHAHGATLEVKSQHGSGASFFFSLPRRLPSQGLPNAVPLGWREGLRS